MGANAQPDFGGYATKSGLRCSDGRVIMPDAFKHQDKMRVPLVWQHRHNEPTNVLGHAILEQRTDGVYAHGYFNDTEHAQHAQSIVEHGDVVALSIYANQLKQTGAQVEHGAIREVSLVLAGANPGALIDNISIRHGDDVVEFEDEADIFNDGGGLDIAHAAEDKKTDEGDGETVQDVYDSMSDKQKEVVHFMVGAAAEAATESADAAAHSDLDDDGDEIDPDNSDETDDESDLEHTDNDGKEVLRMSRNAFEANGGPGTSRDSGPTLSHDDLLGILKDGQERGNLKPAIEAYALQHNIGSIELLFPDARNITQTPEWDKRRTEWVAGVLDGTSKTPFARIKTLLADITMEQARARGYIKGNLKKEEWFELTGRTTGPTTVYKKQKLDRDDLVDIVDIDVVTWLWGEMRLMLEEELARAILIGDGRPVEDPQNAGSPNPDKIRDPQGAKDGLGVRSILYESDIYAATFNVNIDDANSSYNEVVAQIKRSLTEYKGTGNPTFYTTKVHVTEMLLLEDGFGRYKYESKARLAEVLGVKEIVEVEVMEGEADLLGIIVNLKDYTIGTDKGGEITKFDDFDIDYNQYKYLLETRLSGALTKIRSAIILKKVAAAKVKITPTTPTFDKSTGVVTIPTQTGTVYKNATTGATLTAGAQTALAMNASIKVRAEATGNYYYDSNIKDEWTFKRTA